jgi:periplasmic glucans biosynthesis protein
MTLFPKSRPLWALLTCAGVVVAITPAYSQVQPAASFTYASLQQLASALAQKSFEAPSNGSARGTDNIDYDQFRQIRFRRERTIWRGEGLNFELQVLPTGWLFKTPIEINLIEGGNVHPLAPDNAYFDFGVLADRLPPDARIEFSGFRITGPLNRPDLFDEILVFQGASYFRALSRGQLYGLSARGLALNVGRPEGEEFPLFKRFWIEKPPSGGPQLVIYALLDSVSVVGAYRFNVFPGSPTAIDVQATLYPRKEMSNVGIAPLTSMFLFSGIDRSRVNDFRPAVHDSDGLAILNGWGEHLWRPLNNPRRLQTSDFVDQNPRGFGLAQHARTFAGFEDLEAGYERRPSAWIEPRDSWGPGAVELFEIPSEEEIHDNIVAFWKPAQHLEPGKSYAFNYRLSWPNDTPRSWPGAVVHATRSGPINGPQRNTGIVQFVVDFDGLPANSAAQLPFARAEASTGTVSAPVVQANSMIDGLRVSFSFDPKGATSSELRLVLLSKENAISDTWLYRWTKN